MTPYFCTGYKCGISYLPECSACVQVLYSSIHWYKSICLNYFPVWDSNWCFNNFPISVLTKLQWISFNEEFKLTRDRKHLHGRRVCLKVQRDPQFNMSFPLGITWLKTITLFNELALSHKLQACVGPNTAQHCTGDIHPCHKIITLVKSPISLGLHFHIHGFMCCYGNYNYLESKH